MGVSHTLWPPSIARAILACPWFAQGLHKARKNQNSRAVLWCSGWFHVFNFIDRCNLFFSTLLKGIIRKECQSFTNHGHDKTPPTVFNPLSLWLTLPRDMGGGAATHYCLPALPEPFLRACGLHRVCTRLKKNQNSRAVLWCSGWFHVWVHLKKCHSPLFTPVGSTCVAHIFQKKTFSSGFMYSILSIEATYYFHVPKGQLWSCFDLFVWRLFHPKRTFQTNQNSFFILYIKIDNFAVWNYLTSS